MTRTQRAWHLWTWRLIAPLALAYIVIALLARR
jgi:hypothetical protein